MTGNVAELCFNEVGSNSHSIVIRGGSWSDNYLGCKLSYRSSYSKNMTYVGLGFRLVFNQK
ncbi:MAG: hypothetical protein JXR70_10925 [Spirochaetales bacterium]|nr:hypothetical protein [Spirochaetales bacterium]